MAKTKRKRSVGLGDTIEKITEATGIDKVVKFIAGEDCGCDERKEKLNKLFPYKKLNCLTEQEHTYLSFFFEKNSNRISLSEQKELLKIKNRVFGTRNEPTSCQSCWVSHINELKKIWNEYND